MRKDRVMAYLLLSLLFGGLLFSAGIGGPRIVEAQKPPKKSPPNVPSAHVYDSYPHPNTRGAMRYALADKWNKTNLTYQFDNCPALADCEKAKATLRSAFAGWAQVSPLRFSEVSGGADIEISWAGAEQDMGAGSDTLGVAYFPSDGGDLYLNNTIAWEFGTGTDSDLYLTAAHEIGHTLGLDHSSDPAALMYPNATDQTTGIAADDIQGIQALYGTPDGSTPTLNVDNTPSDASVDNSGGSPDSGLDQGAIDDSTPYELWDIDVSAGETLMMTMSTVEGDLIPHLGILTSDQNVMIAESDNSGGTQSSVTVTFPDAGPYVIMATREGVEDGTSQGTYTLDIQTADSSSSGADSTESGDTNMYNGTVQVSNFTGTDVCEIYISAAGGSEWDGDLLNGQSLADGASISSDFAEGSYDALAVTCDGAEIEGYGFSLSQNSSVEIYADTITAP